MPINIGATQGASGDFTPKAIGKRKQETSAANKVLTSQITKSDSTNLDALKVVEKKSKGINLGGGVLTSLSTMTVNARTVVKTMKQIEQFANLGKEIKKSDRAIKGQFQKVSEEKKQLNQCTKELSKLTSFVDTTQNEITALKNQLQGTEKENVSTETAIGHMQDELATVTPIWLN